MTDSDERRKMALQINPNIGAPITSNDPNAKTDAPAIGTPNQDAANQLKDLLKNPSQDSGAPASTGSPFGSPFKPAQNPGKKGADNAPPPFSAPTQSEAKTSADPKSNSVASFGAQAKPENKTSVDASTVDVDTSTGQSSTVAQSTSTRDATSLSGTSPNTTALSNSSSATNSSAGTAPPSNTSAPTQSGVTTAQQGTQNTVSSQAGPTSAEQSSMASHGAKSDIAATPQPIGSNLGGSLTGESTMSNTAIGGGNPGVGNSTGSLGDQKSSSESMSVSGSGSLSDSQLAAAASLNTAAGIQPTGGISAPGKAEEVVQPHVDGEKIEAMMKSVTKELGMRDLSNLKLGGEMTLKLDQGALPNTEVKVRFEGNEMVISIDSKTADVNQFCTDNLSLLQQSVSSGMKEEMKVRIEVRNPPTDQPNQRKENQSGGQGGGSQGGSSGNSQQQSQNSEGDSLAS